MTLEPYSPSDQEEATIAAMVCTVRAAALCRSLSDEEGAALTRFADAWEGALGDSPPPGRDAPVPAERPHLCLVAGGAG